MLKFMCVLQYSRVLAIQKIYQKFIKKRYKNSSTTHLKTTSYFQHIFTPFRPPFRPPKSTKNLYKNQHISAQHITNQHISTQHISMQHNTSKKIKTKHIKATPYIVICEMKTKRTMGHHNMAPHLPILGGIQDNPK